MVSLRDEDGGEIPREFLVYYERGNLDYKHSPSGVALVLGVVSTGLGLLMLLIHEMPGDRRWGPTLVIAGSVMFVVARIAWLRQNRSFQRRMTAYTAWKESKLTEPSPTPSPRSAD